MDRKFTLTSAAVIVIAILGVWFFTHNSSAPKTTTSAQHTATVVSKPVSFDKSQYSLNDPASIWIIVNKQRPLQPLDYIPADLVVPNVPLRVPGNESMQLRQAAATALEKLFAAAQKQGIQLMLSSGYRSYAYQTNLYGSYVKSNGKAQADTFSARPGYSEHQTGLAADIEPLNQTCDVDPCFGNLPEGKWLAANAYLYGFVIRYTEANQAYTGYIPEAWHIRYVGTALSGEIHKTDISSLEQFFGLPAAPHY